MSKHKYVDMYSCVFARAGFCAANGHYASAFEPKRGLERLCRRGICIQIRLCQSRVRLLRSAVSPLCPPPPP